MLGLVSMMPLANSLNLMEDKDKKTPLLKAGDKVGVVAPSGPIKDDRFEYVTENLSQLGLEPVFGKYIRGKSGFLSGTDAERLEDFHSAYANKDIKAVWCLRGGYGTTRILDQLDYKLIKKNVKPLIGYSDITGPLLSIYRKTGIMGIHATMLASKWSEFTLEQTRDMLFGERNEFQFEPIPEGERTDGEFAYTIVSGKAEGQLFGGNLTLLASMCGTDFLPKFKNRLVFIEDVGEEPYRIDRMLTQLKSSTDLEEAAGFVLGIFNDCKPEHAAFSFSLKETLTSQFSAIGKPTYYGAPFGHIDKIAPIPVGGTGSIDADRKLLLVKC